MGVLELFNLSGKVAIVTGSSRGLGRGIAVGLAEAGADIVAVATGDQAETKREDAGAGAAVRSGGGGSGFDLVRPKILHAALDAFGRVDILMNNAGIIRRADLVDFTEKDRDDVINVNQRTLFFLSQAVAKQMIAQGRGGRIINVASMLSFQGGIRVASYTANKSAVMGLTRIFANELARHGITVDAIAPGYMETDNTAHCARMKSVPRKFWGRFPAGRWGSANDLRGAAVFLACRCFRLRHRSHAGGRWRVVGAVSRRDQEGTTISLKAKRRWWGISAT